MRAGQGTFDQVTALCRTAAAVRFVSMLPGLASRTALVLLSAITILALFASSADAAFPGRNGRIAFVRQSGRLGAHVWTMKADGSSQTQLLARRGTRPTWSPRGTRLAFDDYGLHGQGGTIMVANADGSNVRELKHGRAFRDPAWSPNGRQIVFTGFADGPVGEPAQAYRILIMNSDDGRITFRSRAPLQQSHGSAPERPAWSPRAERIAFELGPYHRGFDSSEAFTMKPDGKDLRQLTRNRASETDLDWSPDGSRLLFVRVRNHAQRPPESDIVVMGRNGHDVHVLTHTKRNEGSAGFSPNGRKIVFDRCCYGESQTSEIFVMRSDGTHVVRLTHNEVPDYWPDWQPIPR